MKKNLTIIIILLVLANLGLNVWDRLENNQEIAFVRSQDLIYKYEGMMAAQREFESKTQAWTANSDTLMSLYQQTLNQYRDSAEYFSKEKRKYKEMQLMKKQENVQKYQEATASKMEEEEQKMLEGVLNQVNSFVETYAEKHDYDIILGTTLSGSLLYGEDQNDITDEVLKALNQHYKNGNLE